MKNIVLLVLLLSNISFAFAQSTNTTILVDASALQKANPDKVMFDGEIYVDIDNDTVKDVVRYAYNASAPSAACSNEKCVRDNNKTVLQPILTFDIFLKGPGATIPVNYMCTTIGVMKSIHNGMKDLYCGPSSILQWNGEDYVEKAFNDFQQK